MSPQLETLQAWAVPRLHQLLPLDQDDLAPLVAYINTLSDAEAAHHLQELLGNSPEAIEFVALFIQFRSDLRDSTVKTFEEANRASDGLHDNLVPKPHSQPVQLNQSFLVDPKDNSTMAPDAPDGQAPSYAPPPGPPPSAAGGQHLPVNPPSGPTPKVTRAHKSYRPHTNAVIEAGRVRARDEQEMQQLLQNLQYQYGIYNSDVEPEHETEYWCNCPIHQYQARKWRRLGVLEMWAQAVMYPGEKSYNDSPYNAGIFSSNPYRFTVVSPYGYGFNRSLWASSLRPIPAYHARNILQTIDLNNSLNRKAQANVEAREPKHSIWDDDALEHALSSMSIDEKKRPKSLEKGADLGYPNDKSNDNKRNSLATPDQSVSAATRPGKASRMTSFRKTLGIKSSEERAVSKVEKAVDKGKGLRDEIIAEEEGRWPDAEWRQIVLEYQAKVGMLNKIAELRAKSPIQYLHLLRAGYFEPIPVAWADQASNPLKFSIEASAGWRGITPAWRGYEDTAEERLYWVLNHREGSVGARLKPDFISEMNMARERMARAVDPPPLYFSADDTCHLQHTSEGYSKQVLPSPFRPFDRPEQPTDDTMILLDVSGSMDFDPVRPIYDQYTVTGYAKSTQPKNKDVAKAIIRRFTDAMANHDHNFTGYDFVTFSNQAKYIGSINHQNLNNMWQNVRIGGGTRVMTGWQLVKDLHFQKHKESATHHPVYGWQAGPETPILRLLLLLDGEATDMDEFELDLLGLSWAHVTIFLIGVDGCPHHHRHANELSRIADTNHHISFVDAQGNCPERFVTHELLKRHLGYDISMQEFQQMEELPPYSE